eukprot:48337-Amphidinium_carterae.2
MTADRLGSIKQPIWQYVSSESSSQHHICTRQLCLKRFNSHAVAALCKLLWIIRQAREDLPST